MTELEMYKKALALAECNFKSMSIYSGTFAEQAKNTLSGIAAILNPPPEMTTVIESIWRHKTTMEVVDNQPPLADLDNWQEYAGSVKRPVPQKVEKSATAIGVKWRIKNNQMIPDGAGWSGDIDT